MHSVCSFMKLKELSGINNILDINNILVYFKTQKVLEQYIFVHQNLTFLFLLVRQLFLEIISDFLLPQQFRLQLG